MHSGGQCSKFRTYSLVHGAYEGIKIRGDQAYIQFTVVKTRRNCMAIVKPVAQL